MYYILKGHEVIPEPDIMKWSTWFGTTNHRVKRSDLEGDVMISTVFIGLNHNWGDGPLHLFETMVFREGQDGEMKRYSTWEEAEAGHDAMVSQILSEVE